MNYLINIITITESTLQGTTNTSTISLETTTEIATSVPKGDLKNTI